MTNPYRALCAELLNGLDELAHPRYPFPGYTCCAMDRARALLAQEAVGPSEKELYDLFCEYEREPVESMRAALARWGRPAAAPVPVSKRLPGPEDCDAEGKVWGTAELGGWMRVHHSKIGRWRAWLPANALPTPEATND